MKDSPLSLYAQIDCTAQRQEEEFRNRNWGKKGNVKKRATAAVEHCSDFQK